MQEISDPSSRRVSSLPSPLHRLLIPPELLVLVDVCQDISCVSLSSSCFILLFLVALQHVNAMSSSALVASPTRLLPFHRLIDGVEPITLMQLSCLHAVPLSDLYLANPNLSHLSCDDNIPPGTVIQFPPLLAMRLAPYGSSFVVKDMWDAMSHCDTALGALAAAASLSPSFPPVPKRAVASKTAHLVDVLRRESALQLAKLQQEYGEIDPNSTYGKSWKELLVEEAVDGTLVHAHMRAVDDQFASCGLISLRAEHQKALSVVPVRSPPNALTELRLHTVLDRSAAAVNPLDEHLTCSFHRRELLITVYKPGSVVAEYESWAVLPCQTVGALVDALECPKSMLPYPSIKNSFAFIGGTFYIDDRHEGFQDLSEVIRTFDPIGSGTNGAYGSCPVKSMKTRFADVRVRLRELCVFRHLGCCDHYFVVTGVSPSVPPRPRLEYPRRTFYAVPKVTLCELCQLLPATICTYGDRLAPKNPTLYCPPCFRIFHVDHLGEEVNDGYVKFELPPGKHF